mmetsp:Transcript_4605/g.7243  ORF Transcript_4605/g.7243 Transcript_4605/m.7243 type:complete len:220 (-) Transcript_4605:329-988(-)
MENCGYNGNTTSCVIPSALICSVASSVKGFQYRMPTYTSAACPLAASDCFKACACSSVMRLRGDPPPMLSYALRDLGARELDSSAARGDCRNRTAAGRRMMSGSANKLYRNGCTSSSSSGPPRFSNRMPTFSVTLTGSPTLAAGDRPRTTLPGSTTAAVTVRRRCRAPPPPPVEAALAEGEEGRRRNKGREAGSPLLLPKTWQVWQRAPATPPTNDWRM